MGRSKWWIAKMKLLFYDDLKYKHEIFLTETPVAYRIFILVVFLLIGFIISFCCIAKIEQVVYAKGKVRPEENISIVRNIISGTVLEKNFSSGVKVSEGEVLLRIADDVYAEQYKTIKNRYELNEKEIQDVEQLISSYKANKNLIDKQNEIPYYRFKIFEDERNRLYAEYERAENFLTEAKALPENSIEPARIRELTFNRDVAYHTYTNYRDKFITSLNNEYESLTLQAKANYTSLCELTEVLKNHNVVSPITGYIQEASSINEGDYLSAGQLLVTVVPTTEQKYTVELQVNARDAGKIIESMQVKYRFSAFPFHEFGGAEGKIITIEPDSIVDAGDVYFNVIANLDRVSLKDKQHNAYEIKNGFEVNARIILKEQTILWYILSVLDFV